MYDVVEGGPILPPRLMDYQVVHIESEIKQKATEEQLEEFCRKVKRNLDRYSYSNRRLALEALNAKVIAMPEQVEIRIAVPLEFITIEQTSGYMLNHNKNRMSKVFVKAAV